MSEQIKKFLKREGVEYRERFDISRISAVRIGGTAEIAAYPRCEEELISLVRFLRDRGEGYRVVGGASNILFGDGNIKTVIIFTGRISSIRISDKTIFAECGARLGEICKLAREASLGGLEELSGIPGSVGGAVAGNSGAFGAELSDYMEYVRAYDPRDDTIREIPASECGFSYRSSRFSCGEELVLSLRLRLKSRGQEEISERSEHFRRLRMEKQPYDMPSLGCTFKKTGDFSAGELIDRCGLKGFSLGGALVSSRHAGFIVNRGGATAADYIALAYLCRKSVFERFHLNIEPEIKFLMH